MARPQYHDAEIEAALLESVDTHPRDLVRIVAGRLAMTRPTVLKRVQRLIDCGYLESSGGTRPRYMRGANRRRVFRHPRAGLAEDEVWRRDVRPLLDGLEANVLAICQHGLTEMLNNAIDHSGSEEVAVWVDRNRERIALLVDDDGIGIFRRIAQHLSLADERLALLELAKGKFTTDPARHTGEGVFFTSRMFDQFQIVSGGLTFDHRDGAPDDVLVEAGFDARGTTVVMAIGVDSARTVREVFDQFSSGPDDYAFARTVVPVRMAQFGDENLVSRSQARRLLQRVDRFRTVVLDFAGVAAIGQSFADEIFRVFANTHPQVELVPTHAAPEVQQMIRRAQAGQAPLFE
jgi:anti-sigma regulatory factor (Ser/Thr protein kinase)